MKTVDKLMNNGFKLIAKENNGTEVYAKFTGYEDCIQYYYCKDGIVLNNTPETISYSWALLFKGIANELREDCIKNNINIENKWTYKNGSYIV